MASTRCQADLAPRSSTRALAETVLQIIMDTDVEALIGAVLLEANDDWQLQHRYMQIRGHGRAEH